MLWTAISNNKQIRVEPVSVCKDRPGPKFTFFKKANGLTSNLPDGGLIFVISERRQPFWFIISIKSLSVQLCYYWHAKQLSSSLPDGAKFCHPVKG